MPLASVQSETQPFAFVTRGNVIFNTPFFLSNRASHVHNMQHIKIPVPSYLKRLSQYLSKENYFSKCVFVCRFECTNKLSTGHQAAVMCLAVGPLTDVDDIVVTGSKDHYIKVL